MQGIEHKLVQIFVIEPEGKRIEDLSVDGRIILKLILNMTLVCGLDSFGSE
jgi:hypothetical protein